MSKEEPPFQRTSLTQQRCTATPSLLMASFPLQILHGLLPNQPTSYSMTTPTQQQHPQPLTLRSISFNSLASPAPRRSLSTSHPSTSSYPAGCTLHPSLGTFHRICCSLMCTEGSSKVFFANHSPCIMLMLKCFFSTCTCSDSSMPRLAVAVAAMMKCFIALPLCVAFFLLLTSKIVPCNGIYLNFIPLQHSVSVLYSSLIWSCEIIAYIIIMDMDVLVRRRW